MKEKVYKILNKIYGMGMSVAFWGGLVPLPPLVLAICVGGETGEKIAVFLEKQYYPWVIALASVSIVVGLIAMYVNGQEAFSTRSFAKKKADKADKSE